MTGGTNKLKPSEVASETGVSEDDVEDVMEYLVREGWILSRYIKFNTRKSSDLKLPGCSAENKWKEG